MQNPQDFWNNRYAKNAFVYGTKPNAWFKECLNRVASGHLLLPAEGEGRNAIYALEKGWSVDALDFSNAAIDKARKLALEHGLEMFNYQLTDLQTYQIIPQYYDAIGLCYVHAPSEWRSAFHQKMVDGLKTGGSLILEAFSKEQLGKNSGGPKNLDQLFELDDLLKDFEGIEFHISHAVTVKLREGDGHRGEGSVIRLFGQKKV